MSGHPDMVGGVLPPSRQVLRWCEDCQLMTWSIMLDGVERCERWDSHDDELWFEDDDELWFEDEDG